MCCFADTDSCIEHECEISIFITNVLMLCFSISLAETIHVYLFLSHRSCPASPTRTPINITIVTPDQLFASPVTSAGAVGYTSVDSASVYTTSSATNEQPSVQSTVLANTANLSNANNNNIVTIATSSSLAEAITMQQSKGMSHVLDMSGVRAIQSAPGSPLQGKCIYLWTLITE